MFESIRFPFVPFIQFVLLSSSSLSNKPLPKFLHVQAILLTTQENFLAAQVGFCRACGILLVVQAAWLIVQASLLPARGVWFVMQAT